jgi:plastocyanin
MSLTPLEPKLSNRARTWYRLGFAALLAILIAAGQFQVARGHLGDTYTVEMTANGFVPSQLQVLAGDSLAFENSDQSDHWPASDVHPTHQLYPDLDAQRPIAPGESWTFALFRPGVWGFHDHLNPQFTAQVVVLPDTHPVSSDSGGAASEPGGLARFFSAVQRFYERVFEAAGLFLAEAFSAPQAVSQVPPTQAAAAQVETEFRPPTEAAVEAVYAELDLGCASEDFDCLAAFLREETSLYGPTLAIDLFLRLRDDGRVSSAVDEHQLAHHIGRQTAESFGVNENAFLLCPMAALNGGCQHGFFEFVLGKTTTTAEAADLICQSLDEQYSDKFRFYCYHGVGHGVMMAAAYDLERALSICDTFPSLTAQDGCWQGVFMENVNAGMRGNAREGVFSTSDPLAPCNGVAEKYQHECYVNHAGYLMTYFDNDVELATGACLQALEDFIGSCLQSVGLMVTNPVWQPDLLEDVVGKDFVEIAWELCMQFPASRRDQCVLGGIDNIHNFDEFDLSRAISFCDIVDPEYQELCYQRMGINLRHNATDLEEVRTACASLVAKFGPACLAGAGLEPQSPEGQNDG